LENQRIELWIIDRSKAAQNQKESGNILDVSLEAAGAWGLTRKKGSVSRPEALNGAAKKENAVIVK